MENIQNFTHAKYNVHFNLILCWVCIYKDKINVHAFITIENVMVEG